MNDKDYIVRLERMKLDIQNYIKELKIDIKDQGAKTYHRIYKFRLIIAERELWEIDRELSCINSKINQYDYEPDKLYYK